MTQSYKMIPKSHKDYVGLLHYSSDFDPQMEHVLPFSIHLSRASNEHHFPQCFAADCRRCLSGRRSNNAAFNGAVSGAGLKSQQQHRRLVHRPQPHRFNSTANELLTVGPNPTNGPDSALFGTLGLFSFG